MKKSSQKLFFCFIFSMIIFQNVAAQPDYSKKNHIGLDLGLSAYRSKDLMLSPLLYRGNNFSVDLSYLRDHENAFHSAEIYFTLGDINSRVPYHTQTGLRMHILYGYSRQVTTINVRNTEIPAFIGGLLKSHGTAVFPQDYDNATWIFVHSLNISLGLQHKINSRHTVHWDGHFPVLSYVVRPPYAALDEETQENFSEPLKFLTANGKFSALNEYFMLLSKITYLYNLSGKFDFTAKYNFTYQKYDKPRDIRMFANLFSAGLVFKF